MAVLLAAVLLVAVCPASHAFRAFRASDWTLPSGFSVEPYTPGLGPVPTARSLALSGASKPNGPWITYVSALSFAGDPMNINAVVDLKGRGEADYVQPIVVGLSSMPNGIAWNKGSLFIASLDPYKSCTLYRLDNPDSYALGRRAAALSDLAVVLDNLSPDFWHGWKYIRFGPDGKLYLPIGANCNICRTDGWPPTNGTDPATGEPVYSLANSQDASHVSAPYRKAPGQPAWRFSTIYSLNRDGSNITVAASGVRNTVGFDFHPATGKLYFTDNGRDNWDTANSTKTDNTPDCELNVATTPGQNFGFPYCHTGPVGGKPDARPYLRLPGAGPNWVDPDENDGQAAMRCNGGNLSFRPAIQAMGPHVAPLGMRFYRWTAGANFPPGYDKSIFIAQHGSWNRNRPIGARVMRVVLSGADPTKVVDYQPFLTGGVPGDQGLPSGPNPPPAVGATYNGRPVDVEQLPDGSLLVSDDSPAGGRVLRISYSTPMRCRGQGARQAEEDGEDSLVPTAIPGATSGCAVNLGSYGTRRYRQGPLLRNCTRRVTQEKQSLMRCTTPVARKRCVRMDVSGGGGHWAQLATSLVVVQGQLVLRGALLLPRHTCVNSPTGWLGFGLPSQQGEGDMVGSQVFITRPAPGADTGAVTTDFYLGGTSPTHFSATKGFLATPGSLSAYVSGGALITTFDIVLPYALQLAAASAGKIKPPKPPANQQAGETDRRQLLAASSIQLLMALGNVASDGSMQRHWLAARLSIPFELADMSAALPAALPVLNRGAGPRRPAVPSPPPPSDGGAPAPPSPDPGPIQPCPVAAQCCLAGVQYDACQTSSAAGVQYSQYYAVDAAASTLRVAIKATTQGWIAWSYNPAAPGFMTGGDALFARPCPACATGVSTPAFNLGGYATGLFAAPRRVAYSRLGSGAVGGDIWAAFSLAWPGGAAIKINYGAGSYSGGSAAGAEGMAPHSTIPPQACITLSAGTVIIKAASAC